MSTRIGTFTIKGNDNGNNPYFWDNWIFESNNESFGGGSGSLQSGNINTVLDALVANYYQQFTGSITYTLDGPNSWNTGIDTKVTFTFTDINASGINVLPYFIIFGTEDYAYPIVWQEATPVVPALCNECQFIQLTQCGADNFFLDLGLTDGSYTAYYADNTSGVIWEQGTYSSTAQGGLSMYQWQATSGMFNEYSFYTLTIRDTNGNAVSWIVNGIEYNCATLTFKKTVNVTD